MPRPLKRYKPRVKKYDHGGAHPKKSETDIPLSQASGGFKLYRQFYNYLRTFHAITIQLKVNGFAISNKTCITLSCPLGKGGIKWNSS